MLCQCQDQPDHFSHAVISINGIKDEVTSYITWCTVLHECQIAAYRSCVVWALISHMRSLSVLTLSLNSGLTYQTILKICSDMAPHEFWVQSISLECLFGNWDVISKCIVHVNQWSIHGIILSHVLWLMLVIKPIVPHAEVEPWVNTFVDVAVL